MATDQEVTQIYTVVEAKSVNELVRLTNLKTKNGWNCIGGICYAPNNVCEADSQLYPFCQSMYRMEKLKGEKPAKAFVAFPYKEGKTVTPALNQNKNHKNKKYAHRTTTNK